MSNRNLSFQLPVIVTKQGRSFVAYSPALDISTSGKSEKVVQKRFVEAVSLFLEEIVEMGTANDVLTELGWTKVQKRWNPPQVVSSNSIGEGIKRPIVLPRDTSLPSFIILNNLRLLGISREKYIETISKK